MFPESYIVIAVIAHVLIAVLFTFLVLTKKEIKGKPLIVFFLLFMLWCVPVIGLVVTGLYLLYRAKS